MVKKTFSNLESFGLDNLEDLEIYKKEEPKVKVKKEKSVPKVTEIDVNTLLFNKTVTCPVCSNEFTCRAVKYNSPRIKSRDSDFFIRYYIINPYFYDVWLCDRCGYAALKSDFHKIKGRQITNIHINISNRWRSKYYPPIYDEKIAIERYKLALLNAVVSERKDSTKAFICLKIAWMYRMLEETEEEKLFLEKALQGFLIAFQKEPTPIYNLDKYSLMYLIGELYRRCGDYDNAKLWLGKVVTSIGAPSRIKDKARDMRDLAKESEGS